MSSRNKFFSTPWTPRHPPQWDNAAIGGDDDDLEDDDVFEDMRTPEQLALYARFGDSYERVARELPQEAQRRLKAEIAFEVPNHPKVLIMQRGGDGLEECSPTGTTPNMVRQVCVPPIVLSLPDGQERLLDSPCSIWGTPRGKTPRSRRAECLRRTALAAATASPSCVLPKLSLPAEVGSTESSSGLLTEEKFGISFNDYDQAAPIKSELACCDLAAIIDDVDEGGSDIKQEADSVDITNEASSTLPKAPYLGLDESDDNETTHNLSFCSAFLQTDRKTTMKRRSLLSSVLATEPMEPNQSSKKTRAVSFDSPTRRARFQSSGNQASPAGRPPVASFKSLGTSLTAPGPSPSRALSSSSLLSSCTLPVTEIYGSRRATGKVQQKKRNPKKNETKKKKPVPWR